MEKTATANNSNTNAEPSAPYSRLPYAFNMCNDRLTTSNRCHNNSHFKSTSSGATFSVIKHAFFTAKKKEKTKYTICHKRPIAVPDEVRLMRQNRAAGSDKHTSVYLELLTVQNRKPAVVQAETRPADAEEGGKGENESGWTVRSGGKEEKWGPREGGGNQYSAGWLTCLTPSCLGGGSGPRSQEVGEEGDYIYPYRYTATTRITPALRCVAMRTILVFH